MINCEERQAKAAQELLSDIIQNVIEDIFAEENIKKFAPALKKLVEMKCFAALSKIKAILEDSSLEDKECFLRIEKVVIALEELGSNGGVRHDF